MYQWKTSPHRLKLSFELSGWWKTFDKMSQRPTSDYLNLYCEVLFPAGKPPEIIHFSAPIHSHAYSMLKDIFLVQNSTVFGTKCVIKGGFEMPGHAREIQ